jgi:hypothetical protein
MKTAMQELMDALNDLEAVYLKNDWRREVIGINQAKNLIEHIYLKKEERQIKDAWIDGDNSDSLSEQDSSDFAEQYYNETFNSNER